MQWEVGKTEVRLLKGDITQVTADAIVNAANSALAGGGGVDGAIHRAGGPSIMDECRRIGGCPTGSAVATGAGKLPARFVVHAVAPVWKGGNGSEAALLGGAYRTSLQLACDLGLTSIAFPSLGTGAHDYPVDEAAEIALGVVRDVAARGYPVATVTFVLFSENDLATYQRAAGRIFEDGVIDAGVS